VEKRGNSKKYDTSGKDMEGGSDRRHSNNAKKSTKKEKRRQGGVTRKEKAKIKLYEKRRIEDGKGAKLSH